eukprot:13069216-Alexandrium_andersonii.AAC.1
MMYNHATRPAQDEKLGGPGKAVRIDDAYFTKRKHNRSGFGGRAQGHKIIVLGMEKLDLQTRQCAGRARLIRLARATGVNIRVQ